MVSTHVTNEYVPKPSVHSKNVPLALGARIQRECAMRVDRRELRFPHYGTKKRDKQRLKLHQQPCVFLLLGRVACSQDPAAINHWSRGNYIVLVNYSTVHVQYTNEMCQSTLLVSRRRSCGVVGTGERLVTIARFSWPT